MAAGLWTATAAVLGLGVAQMVFVGVFGNRTFLGKLRVLSLDGELCLPAWYSSLLMAAAAAMAALCGMDARRRGAGGVRAWLTLAVIFVYLSLDEMVSLHETLVPVMRRALDPKGFFTFGWVIVAIPVVALVGAMFLPFLFRLPRPIGRRIAVAGLVFVAGALGMEMVGGKLVSTVGRAPIYYAAVFAEESLEMVGVVLFLLVLFDHLGRNGTLAIDLAVPAARKG